MTEIKLNPEKLKQSTDALDSLGSDASGSKTKIDNECTNLGDKFSPEIETFNTSAHNAIEELNRVSSDISHFRTYMVLLNEDGIAATDSDGIVTAVVPNGVTIDSGEDFMYWAAATIDAYDLNLTAHGKKPRNGRTYEQVVDSIKSNYGNYDYSNNLIDAIGPENLTDWIYAAERQYPSELGYDQGGEYLADVFGVALANASLTWGPTKSDDVVSKIYSSLEGPSSYTDISALNVMLDGHDSEGNAISMNFDPSFLCNLAAKLEAIDLKTVNKQYDDDSKWATDPREYPRFGLSIDPLAGVLEAMGNQPDAAAAMQFLAPAKDGNESEVDVTRIKNLSARNWDSQGFAGFVNAVNMVATQRTSIDETVSRTPYSERATRVLDNAVHGIAENVPESAYDDTAKERVGLMLARCGPEMLNALSGGDGEVGSARDQDTFLNCNHNDFGALAYRIADNNNAMATVSNAIAAESISESNRGTVANEGSPSQQTKAIHDAYARGERAEAYLGGLADIKLGYDNTGKSEQAKVGMGVFNTAMSTGLSAIPEVGPAASAAWTMGSKVAEPIILSKTATKQAQQNADNSEQSLWMAAVRDAANCGALNPKDFEEGSDYSWIKQNADGSHSIDYSSVPDQTTAYHEVQSWKQTVDTRDLGDTDGRGDPTLGDTNLTNVIDDFHESWSNGKTDAQTEAEEYKK